MPPPAKAAAAATPGPSARARNPLADALYEWARKNHDYGHVFLQNDLLDSNIIPDRDLNILLQSTQSLVSRRLLKLHDIKGQEGVGWELIAPEIAQSYEGLTADEQMVYAMIESAGTMGIWTKAIKARVSVHAKVLEGVYKRLEQRQLIKQMKSVKNPGRKMYILYNLQPSEETTGGAWYTEGKLDMDLMSKIAKLIEFHCADRSWIAVQDDTADSIRKRKQPDSGFDEARKGKSSKLDEHDSVHKASIHFEPHPPGFTDYPTARELSRHILESQLLHNPVPLPDVAISQLVDVMAYDGRIRKLSRPVRAGEISDVPHSNMITTYRAIRSPQDLQDEDELLRKIEGAGSRGNARAERQLEIEDIGRGGTSEVPCLGCPNFEICGDGGPINAATCEYFDEWFKNMEEADELTGDIWPSNKKSIKPRTTSSRR